MAHVIQSFSGRYAFLSNFFPATISWSTAAHGELVFPTNEHAFQACKYKAITDSWVPVSYLEEIQKASTPSKAKDLGNSVKIDVDKWDGIKVECMRKVVFEKFRQHEDLRKSLLDTGHALLVEGNTWGDKFWGRCEGKGYNILGAILMETRGYWHWVTNTTDLLTPGKTDLLAYPHGE